MIPDCSIHQTASPLSLLSLSQGLKGERESPGLRSNLFLFTQSQGQNGLLLLLLFYGSMCHCQRENRTVRTAEEYTNYRARIWPLEIKMCVFSGKFGGREKTAKSSLMRNLAAADFISCRYALQSLSLCNFFLHTHTSVRPSLERRTFSPPSVAHRNFSLLLLKKKRQLFFRVRCSYVCTYSGPRLIWAG